MVVEIPLYLRLCYYRHTVLTSTYIFLALSDLLQTTINRQHVHFTQHFIVFYFQRSVTSMFSSQKLKIEMLSRRFHPHS